VGQREDTGCDEDGVDVSIGVDVGAIVGEVKIAFIIARKEII